MQYNYKCTILLHVCVSFVIQYDIISLAPANIMMYLKHKLVWMCWRSQVSRQSVSSCNPHRVRSRRSCCSRGSKDLGGVFGNISNSSQRTQRESGPTGVSCHLLLPLYSSCSAIAALLRKINQTPLTAMRCYI